VCLIAASIRKRWISIAAPPYEQQQEFLGQALFAGFAPIFRCAMSRRANACLTSEPSRLEQVLRVGLRAVSIGVTTEGDSETRATKLKSARLADVEDEFMTATHDATTEDDICVAANALLQHASRECKSGPISLELQRSPNPVLCECVGDDRWPFIAFLGKDYYLTLTFGEACTLATIGIKRQDAKERQAHMFQKDYLEIFCNTAPTQYCKGYNSLLTAVAVMIACKQEKVLYSYNVNEQNLSSYTLMRSYQFLRAGESQPRGPLKQEEACAASKKRGSDDMGDSDSDSDDVGVVPNAYNFERAQLIVIARAVQCAEAGRLQGAPGIPRLRH